MNLNEIKTKPELEVYSLRVSQTLVIRHGVKELINIKQVPSIKDKTKNIRVYVFRNSPSLFETFESSINENN